MAIRLVIAFGREKLLPAWCGPAIELLDVPKRSGWQGA
jgi:hypothetical protein